MAEEGTNPFLITPPPGLLPPPRETVEPSTGDTVGGDSSTRRISPPREPVVARPPGAQGIPFVTPTTQVSQPEPPPPSTVVAVAPDHLDNDETRVIEPSDRAPGIWRLVLPDGSSTTITSAVFVGRNPTRTTGDVEGSLLPVDDTTKSVSKTHALIEVVDGHLWVTDLNSTNGVFVTAEGQDDVFATAGERTYVPVGSDIELGEFVIQVERG